MNLTRNLTYARPHKSKTFQDLVCTKRAAPVEMIGGVTQMSHHPSSKTRVPKINRPFVHEAKNLCSVWAFPVSVTKTLSIGKLFYSILKGEDRYDLNSVRKVKTQASAFLCHVDRVAKR